MRLGRTPNGALEINYTPEEEQKILREKVLQKLLPAVADLVEELAKSLQPTEPVAEEMVSQSMTAGDETQVQPDLVAEKLAAVSRLNQRLKSLSR